MRIVVCRHCGVEFTAVTRGRHTFCSKTCAIFAKVSLNENTMCLEFGGAKSPFGYGLINVKNRSIAAHVVITTAVHGDKPFKEAVVMHSCDNPACVNPAHLSWGTQAQNLADCKSRGRMRRVRGQNHPRGKLSDSDINDIHFLNSHRVSRGEIAALFNITAQHAGQVILGHRRAMP